MGFNSTMYHDFISRKSNSLEIHKNFNFFFSKMSINKIGQNVMKKKIIKIKN